MEQKNVADMTEAEMLTEIVTELRELKKLVSQAEPFLDSFMGAGGAPKSPLNMIMGSLMGGGR